MAKYCGMLEFVVRTLQTATWCFNHSPKKNLELSDRIRACHGLSRCKCAYIFICPAFVYIVTYISGPFASLTIVSGSVLIGRFSLFLGQCSPNYPGCEYSNFSVTLFIQESVEFGTER